MRYGVLGDMVLDIRLGGVYVGICGIGWRELGVVWGDTQNNASCNA